MGKQSLLPLPTTLLVPLVQAALSEDLGRRGDITSQILLDSNQTSTLLIKTRQTGVIAGIQLAKLAFQLLDAEINFSALVSDGDKVVAGQTLAKVSGNSMALLSAERTALNYLTHLSGIASATAQIVDLLKNLPTKLTCTRKTIPGLRSLQKYAVRAGGGQNHRLGLDDAILIKDNHIALAGSITAAINRAKQAVGPLVAIEIEVDNLNQLTEVLANPTNLVLLDNMDCASLTQAVQMCQGKILTEASGGITPANVQKIAATGVDFVAVGWLTHSSKALDIGFDIN